MFGKINFPVLGISMLFLLAAFSLSSLNAQDNSNKLLKSVQDKFNSATAISADVKQVNNGKTGLSGRVYFKKVNKFRAELKSNTIISDGSTTWNYSKKENKVIINGFDASNPSALSINTIINDYPSKSDVTSSTESGKNVITLTPKKNSGLNFSSAKLWINENNLVDKISVVQPGGNVFNIEISNYKLNQEIPNSQFSFNPPQGTTVVDLR